MTKVDALETRDIPRRKGRSPDDHLLAGPEGVTEVGSLRWRHRPGRPRVRRWVISRSGQRAATMPSAPVAEETPHHHDFPSPHGIAAGAREICRRESLG